MDATGRGPPTAGNGGFEGKVVLVTGASRGIGAATASAFAVRGARVALAARDRTALDAVAEGIRSRGGIAEPVPLDLAVPESIREMAEAIDARWGRLDVAVNNAGEGYPPTPLAEVPVEAFERVMRVSVMGTFLALREEIPRILRNGGGSIVNISSTAGVSAFAGGGPYVAAKHAMLGLTKAAALDYAQQGLRVNALAPGPIDTHRLKAAPEAYRAQARQAVPMRRLGAPEEVAEAAVWLSSDGARFVTGVTLFLDGGRMAGFA